VLRLDTHTKGLFLSGVFVYLTTVSGLVYNYSILQENHSVRLGHLEKEVKVLVKNEKELNMEVGTLRTEAATVVHMLKSLDKNVLQLTRTTTELGKIAARLDERSRGIN
jgi:peptidoglycan hydrolase CwlO-like protein